MQCLSQFFWFQLGCWLERHGLVALAESCFRDSAAGRGKSGAKANYQLGKSLLSRGGTEQALAAFARAVELDPKHVKAWCALGAAQRMSANLIAAREAYNQALELDPDYPLVLSNLGELCLVQGHAEDALAYFDRALEQDKTLLEGLANRTAALLELGRYEEAEQAALYGVECYPQSAAIQGNYGNILWHSGKTRLAVKAYRKALECDPSCVEAHINLATLFGETEHLIDAIQYLEKNIAIKGETAQSLASLALAYAANKDHIAAESLCRRALKMQPGLMSALVTMAGCHSNRGEHGEAISCLELALKSRPEMPGIASNICFNSTYLLGVTPAMVFERHSQWACQFETPLIDQQYQHVFVDDPCRLLRIGYVSGDFGMHPVGFLLRDVISHHDPSNFEIHCFSMMRKDDEVTLAIKEKTLVWHDILMEDDAAVAKLIFDKKIDILIDLSGHTAYNRLSVFARKPAPVQVTWIGYFHSTGMKSIDYFITDPHTSPVGCNQVFSEIPVYLPHSRFCYSPPAYAPEVSPAPFLERGRITFGSFNRLEKLTDNVLKTWAEILDGVQGSRLLIKAGGLDNDTSKSCLRDRLYCFGLNSEQFELRGASVHSEMLKEYGDVDIALDTFPFNGGMTTLEASWMGVPIITLVGEGIVSRQTYSVMANLDLLELTFNSREAYVQGAINLAQNSERLQYLRSQLRSRMKSSPICQPAQFTKDLEALYRNMWTAWSRGEKLSR